MRQVTEQMLRPLPYGLKQQIRNYLDYVSDRLTDLLIERGNLDIRAAVTDEVEFVFAIRFVYQYLHVGYLHYTRMLEFFERQQIGTFRIGSTDYSRSEPLTARWRYLAANMTELIEDSRLRSLITSRNSVDGVLIEVITHHLQERNV